MVNNSLSKEKFSLEIQNYNEVIDELEVLLVRNNIRDDYRFKKWLKDFQKIYGKKDTNLRLYICNSITYFIALLFISKFILDDKNFIKIKEVSIKALKLNEKKIEDLFKNLHLIEFDYFRPLFLISERENMTLYTRFLQKITEIMFKPILKPEYIFDYITQHLIPPILKHSSGEYYTPPFLVKKMIEESYSLGDNVLDPCCGSGNFLIGLIKHIFSMNISNNEKIKAINKVYGFDINPISIFMSKVNFLFLLKDQISKIKLNLFVEDFLFHERNDLMEKFDLIIGNPPWYTYRDVESIKIQKELKKLAEQFEIKPRPKNILNLEISTLFFFKAKTYYLKNEAKIFFVITKGVITGSHAARFRNFKGLSDIKIWEFDKKIQKTFNIDFICLFARKYQTRETIESYEIPSYYYAITDINQEFSYFSNTDLELRKIETLVPFSIENKGNKNYIKKLIPKDKKADLIPLEVSYYKPLFHKGGDLNPRNLIFVKITKVDDLLANIIPDERILKRAKPPWNRREFTDTLVEKKYLFKVVKSTELVKFYLYDHYYVFLPLNRSDLSFNYDELTNNSKKFWDFINNIYLQNKKETTTHNSLLENLNRWAKLINRRQLSDIKVVYNNSGSTINSAVVEGDFLITGDLSFYDTDDLNEAYYLSAVLNSNILSEHIKIMKSSRHIFKLPFNIPIRKFNPENSQHEKLAELGKKGKEIAEKLINEAQHYKKSKITKNYLQQILNSELKTIVHQIDKLLIQDLTNS
ncbi:MAG: N-6 DNA methylase [Promethearchaeota archaeon]